MVCHEDGNDLTSPHSLLERHQMNSKTELPFIMSERKVNQSVFWREWMLWYTQFVAVGLTIRAVHVLNSFQALPVLLLSFSEN